MLAWTLSDFSKNIAYDNFVVPYEIDDLPFKKRQGPGMIN